MLAVEFASQEHQREQGSEEHLSPPHHLVDAGSHAEQSDVHEHRCHKVKDCGYAKQCKLPKLCHRLDGPILDLSQQRYQMMCKIALF